MDSVLTGLLLVEDDGSVGFGLLVLPVPSSSCPLIQAQLGGRYGVKLACGIVKIQYLACAIGISCWE